MITALDIRDWRLRVAELYRQVREAPTPEQGHGAWAEGRARLLREHAASPVPVAERAVFVPTIAPYRPELRFVVPVAPAEPQRREVPTASDGVVPFERVGVVDLDPWGTLDLWWLDSYGGGLFLPLRDGSPRTYGGGRYLLDTVKGADLGGNADALVVDLNFAFQPSCAYSSDWVCPLPGPGNTWSQPVDAGELHVAHA